MNTFIQEGNIISVTAPVGGVSSNQELLIGSLFGIVTCDAAEGDSVEIATTGV